MGRPEAADWNISKEDLSNIRYTHVHRFMTEYFRKLVGGEYYLAPFSLKKGSNIYGLIFASHNPLGLQKFLRVAWLKDPHTGEANFDIHKEGLRQNQLLMFEARKISEFQEDLENRLRSKAFSCDRAIYLHMLQSGFLNRHARRVVAKLCKEKLIAFVNAQGDPVQPRLSNASVSQPRSIVYLDS